MGWDEGWVMMRGSGTGHKGCEVVRAVAAACRGLCDTAFPQAMCGGDGGRERWGNASNSLVLVW